ncbi:MAG: cation:proton antiporter [Bacillota bacterium]|nr:MAG: cation:proton antiporter [Bacillota bacterium]
MIYITYIILALSWFFILFGMITIFRLKNMYARILAATTIDTVASLLVLIGLMLVADSFNFIIRLIVLLLFLLITNPISSHVNIRSAYLMGIPINLKEK